MTETWRCPCHMYDDQPFYIDGYPCMVANACPMLACRRCFMYMGDKGHVLETAKKRGVH